MSYEARKYGVTTSEIRKRENYAESCFKERESRDQISCAEALRWGLSERVYKERSKKAEACWLADEQKLLLAIAKKDRRDHPIWIKGNMYTKYHVGGRLRYRFGDHAVRTMWRSLAAARLAARISSLCSMYCGLSPCARHCAFTSRLA